MAAAAEMPRKVTAQSNDSHMGTPAANAFLISLGPAAANMRWKNAGSQSTASAVTE